MPNTLGRCIISVLLAVAVTACGGGASGDSSGSSEEPPVDRTVSFDQVFVQASEDDVYRFSGQFLTPDSLTLSQSPDIGLEIISFQDNEINLRVPDVDRPSQSDLELTFSYGDQSIVQNLSFLAQNTSAASLILQIDDTLSQRESILELTQDLSLYRFFIDYAYLNGLLTYSQKEEHLAEFSPLVSASRNSLSSAIDNLEAEFEAYRQGNRSDQDLEQSLRLTEQLIREHGHYGSQMLETIQSLVEVLVPGLSSGDLVYVPEVGLYSRFISTPRYGELSDTGFAVADPYEPVKSLIRDRKTQSLMCRSL